MEFMKKVIYFLSVGLVIMLVLFINNKLSQEGRSAITLENIEALAGNGEVTKCPDANYVPNRFLESGGVQSATYRSNESGEISIGGVVKGGYQKNKDVTVSVETFNCSGVEQGACCDQRKVGTKVI